MSCTVQRRLEGFSHQYLRLVQVECALQVIKGRGHEKIAVKSRDERNAEGDSERQGAAWTSDLAGLGARLTKAVVGGIIPSTKGEWWKALGPVMQGRMVVPL